MDFGRNISATPNYVGARSAFQAIPRQNHYQNWLRNSQEYTKNLMGKYNPKYEMIDKKTRSMLKFDNSPTNKGARNTSPKED
jgi:hypothetical protein